MEEIKKHIETLSFQVSEWFENANKANGAIATAFISYVGFNKASLRKAIAIARMDAAKRAKHDAGQMDLELYLAELEGRQKMAEAA